jgi:RHS repeat-associated protein
MRAVLAWTTPPRTRAHASSGAPRWRRAVGLTLCLCVATPAASSAQERVTFFMTDALGSPVVGLDASGSVVWRGDYDPFGQLIAQTGTAATSLRWIGAPYDAESGFLALGPRQYHASLGRFLSADPALIGTLPPNAAAAPARLNLYAYGLSSPYRFVDHSGAFPVEIRHEGYEYRKTTVIGRQPEGNFVRYVPALAMRALQANPNAFFPFNVVGAHGETSLYEGGVFYLMARPGSVPFAPGRNPVLVTELTDWSFTFETLPGHFDPVGSTIRFSVDTDPFGNVVLEQHGRAAARPGDPPRGFLFNQLAVKLANMTWDVQALQLAAFLSTGMLPEQWPPIW